MGIRNILCRQQKGKLVDENLFFAAAAAGLGPALADLIAGYTTYVPGNIYY